MGPNVSASSVPWLVGGFVFALLLLLGSIIVVGHKL
jgi:hypothetical protein